MEEMIWGIIIFLLGIPMTWFGIRQRKHAWQCYKTEVKRYTAFTWMTIIKMDPCKTDTWVTRDDGTEVLESHTAYFPTYEYTVDGRTYQYSGNQTAAGYAVGKRVRGYYDPKNPSAITENKPRKPILDGGLFFIFALFLYVFSIVYIADVLMLW